MLYPDCRLGCTWRRQQRGEPAANETIRDSAALVGRILLASMFVIAGFGKVMGGLLVLFAFGPGAFALDDNSD
jgi:uncharacterized membrane protein YphA (DoxX/SURF4 family)